MKKYIYSFLAAATIMGLASCKGDYEDWKDPQHVEQGEILDPVADGVKNSIGEVSTVYDFATYTSETVKVFTPAQSNVPVTYKVTFGNGKEVESTDGTIATSVLEAVTIDMFGKRPTERAVPAVVKAFIQVAAGISVTAQKAVTVKAIPVAPEIFPHLYLIGAPSEWNPSCTTMQFSHSGNDVYDDPVFTITFPVTEAMAGGDIWFALADDKTVETGDWSNVFGCVEGNGMNPVGEWGKLARRCELPALNPDAGEGSFKVAGTSKFIKVTVNMLDASYLVENFDYEPYIFLPGNAQGWSPEKAAALEHQGDGFYTGFAVMDGEFKFTKARDWGSEYNAGDFKTASADFDISGGAGANIKCTGTGLYYFEVNVAEGELKATKVEVMGLIGGFNGWGEDDVMTWDAENLCFVKEGASVSDAGWKFRLNGDWAVNFGGSLNKLIQNGDNLDAAGTVVKLYPCRTTSENIYCTVE